MHILGGIFVLKKIIAFAVLVTLLCGCSSAYSGLEAPLEGGEPTAEVISDGGLAVKQGEWIYFINGDNFTRNENERFTEYTGALCRMRESGGEAEIVLNKDVSQFNICGDTVYLCIYENSASYAASVKIDGTGFKSIKKIDDIYNGGCYGYTDNYLFYTKDYKLFRLELSSGEEKKVTNFNIYNLRVGRNTTYFTREEDQTIGNIYKLENNGTDYVEITKSPGYVLYVDDNIMYYYMLGNGTVYKYFEGNSKSVIYEGYTEYAFEKDFYIISASNEADGVAGIFVVPEGGGTKRQISENYGACMCVCGDWVYYVNKTKLNYLCRASLDGNKDEKISEEFVYDIDTLDIVGDYLYFFSDSDYDRIYRINLNTCEQECISYDEASQIG